MSTFLRDRRAMRRAAAGLCAVIAFVYLAIGAGLTSIEPNEEMSLVVFGVGAASIFVVGALLLLTLDIRALWAAGVMVQLMIAAMYVTVSADRTPAFEGWGIGIRVAQVPLLVLLVILAVRPTDPGDADAGTPTGTTVAPPPPPPAPAAPEPATGSSSGSGTT